MVCHVLSSFFVLGFSNGELCEGVIPLWVEGCAIVQQSVFGFLFVVGVCRVPLWVALWFALFLLVSLSGEALGSPRSPAMGALGAGVPPAAVRVGAGLGGRLKLPLMPSP